MKPYPRYKPTGLAWLPSVPEHWEATKIRTVFTERTTKVSDKDFPPLSVSKGGVVPQIETVAKSDDSDNRKLVRIGDFVINSRSDRKGSSGISELDGSVSLVNLVLKPRKQGNGRFLHYLLKSDPFVEEFYRNGHGIVADLWTTRYSEMKSIYIPLPPPSEQDRIVRYLDEKTAAIDELVRAKEREIELLRERKQALVSDAVTGGLDPATERKDSGVPWIGTIPKEWKIIPLKRIAKLNPNCVFPENGKEQVLVSFAPMECVRFDSLEHREAQLSNLNSSYSCFNEGDIAIAKVTPCFENGNCCIMTNLTNGFCFGSSELFCLRAGSMIDKRFLLYLFRNESFIDGGCQTMSGTGGLKRVSSEFFRVTPIPVPPLPEQRRIVAHLDSVCSELGAAEATIRKQIDLLQELRTRLVSDAVTGAVEV